MTSALTQASQNLSISSCLYVLPLHHPLLNVPTQKPTMLATELVHLAVILTALCDAASSRTMSARATELRPAACGKPETYCLTVDVSQGLPRNILHPEGAITWITGGQATGWRTYGEYPEDRDRFRCAH